MKARAFAIILILSVCCLRPTLAQVAESSATRFNGPSGDDRAQEVAMDAAGNVYVAGTSSSATSGDDYYTAKYAGASGALLWEKRYNGTGNSTDRASALAVDGAGNVCVTGSSIGTGGTPQYATVKYDASGTQLWAARYSFAEGAGAEARGATLSTVKSGPRHQLIERVQAAGTCPLLHVQKTASAALARAVESATSSTHSAATRGSAGSALET